MTCGWKNRTVLCCTEMHGQSGKPDSNGSVTARLRNTRIRRQTEALTWEPQWRFRVGVEGDDVVVGEANDRSVLRELLCHRARNLVGAAEDVDARHSIAALECVDRKSV